MNKKDLLKLYPDLTWQRSDTRAGRQYEGLYHGVAVLYAAQEEVETDVGPNGVVWHLSCPMKDTLVTSRKLLEALQMIKPTWEILKRDLVKVIIPDVPRAKLELC